MLIDQFASVCRLEDWSERNLSGSVGVYQDPIASVRTLGTLNANGWIYQFSNLSFSSAAFVLFLLLLLHFLLVRSIMPVMLVEGRLAVGCMSLPLLQYNVML